MLLVAKDSPFRRLLREALEHGGHQVTVASDGHEAVARGREVRFEVALLLLSAQGVPQLMGRLRDLDADMEVVWAPPPTSVGQVESLIEGAASRARRRTDGLVAAALGLLEPLRPEPTAARLLSQVEEALQVAASLQAPDPDEPHQALISPDGRRLRVPLWQAGPLPEEDGAEDSGYRLELLRPESSPGLSPAEIARAALFGALGALALTRSHCEQALLELYKDLDRARSQARSAEPAGGGLTAGALAPLERLAGVLAHELNNPLTFVLANLACLDEDLAVLKEDLQLVPSADEARSRCADLQEVLAEAIGGAGRVREVVSDLTTLGTRDEDFGLQAVSMDEVVRAALRIAGREVQRRAQVVVDVDPRLPRVLGSKSRLGQVLLNLLLNALQAVPCGEPQGHEVRILARAEGEQVLISISDTGAGIAKEALPKVFEAGYTTKAVGEGAGLGLAISREIVRTHGGEICIQSQPGAGTTVTVLLPALSAPAATV